MEAAGRALCGYRGDNNPKTRLNATGAGPMERLDVRVG